MLQIVSLVMSAIELGMARGYRFDTSSKNNGKATNVS